MDRKMICIRTLLETDIFGLQIIDTLVTRDKSYYWEKKNKLKMGRETRVATAGGKNEKFSVLLIRQASVS